MFRRRATVTLQFLEAIMLWIVIGENMSFQPQIKGDENTSIHGDHNTILNCNVPLLSKSDIADLLEEVRKLPEKSLDEQPMHLPKELDEKLSFNHVNNWRNIFDEDCPNYNAVVEVMEDFAASSDIMTQLHTMFYKKKGDYMHGDEILGDKLLSSLHDDLCDEIDLRCGAKFSVAVISSFVSSLLKRAVVVCKVLLIPDDKNL